MQPTYELLPLSSERYKGIDEMLDPNVRDEEAFLRNYRWKLVENIDNVPEDDRHRVEIARAAFYAADFYSDPGEIREFVQPHVAELVQLDAQTREKLACAYTMGCIPNGTCFEELGEEGRDLVGITAAGELVFCDREAARLKKPKKW